MSGVDNTRDPADARGKILEAVRNALGDSAGHFAGAPPEPPTIDEEMVRQRRTGDPAAMWAEIAEWLGRLGGLGLLVPDRAEARRRITEEIRQRGLRRGVADPDAADWLGLADGDGMGGAEITRACKREDVFAADFGITTAELAVAETGTIIVRSGGGRARLASLAPPVHFVLVPLERIVADQYDVPSQVGNAEAAGTVWITGPSRTADIEGILIRGVHGPGVVVAVGIAAG